MDPKRGGKPALPPTLQPGQRADASQDRRPPAIRDVEKKDDEMAKSTGGAKAIASTDETFMDDKTKKSLEQYDKGNIDNAVCLFWPIGPGTESSKELRCYLLDLVNGKKDLVPGTSRWVTPSSNTSHGASLS